MNNYALTLVLKEGLSDKDREVLLASITKKFGKVEKEELWGVKDLAYPIKHATKGYYAHYQFSAEPQVAPSLDKALKLEEDIIRYLLIRI